MRKIVISGMVGNALEWYDYALYAQFAGIIANTFFGNSQWRELLTFAVFALGFIIRPLGALLFSAIGDNLGRKTALSLGILSMALPTAVIGLLPSYERIGLLAPVILCLMRLLQGLALGGEFSVCISYLVEHADEKNRGLIGSASFVSMCIGMLFGSLTAFFMRAFIPLDILEGWAWRVPFVLGLAIGLVGLYIRRSLTESPIYASAKARGQLTNSSMLETIKPYYRELIVSMAIYITVTAPFYTLTVYVENFLHKSLGYTAFEATAINTIGLIVMIIVMPIAANLSDKIGRKPMLIFSASLLAISIYPIFLNFGKVDFIMAVVSQMSFAFILACYMGPMPTILVEMFPTKARLTGVALSYNISAAIFGGTAPMTAIILQKLTGNTYIMGVYLSILALVSLFVVLKYLQESYKKQLID